MLTLTVNGKPHEVPEGTTLAALLAQLRVEAPRVAIEVNQIIIGRDQHGAYRLAADDRIEIVTFVGGG